MCCDCMFFCGEEVRDEGVDVALGIMDESGIFSIDLGIKACNGGTGRMQDVVGMWQPFQKGDHCWYASQKTKMRSFARSLCSEDILVLLMLSSKC